MRQKKIWSRLYRDVVKVEEMCILYRRAYSHTHTMKSSRMTAHCITSVSRVSEPRSCKHERCNIANIRARPYKLDMQPRCNARTVTMRHNLKSGFETSRGHQRASRHQRLSAGRARYPLLNDSIDLIAIKGYPVSRRPPVALIYRRRLPSRYICPLSRSREFVLRKEDTTRRPCRNLNLPHPPREGGWIIPLCYE